jgi:hypothetical protein
MEDEDLIFIDNNVYLYSSESSETEIEPEIDYRVLNLKLYLTILRFKYIYIIDEIFYHLPRFDNKYNKKEISLKRCKICEIPLYINFPVFIINSNFIICEWCKNNIK